MADRLRLSEIVARLPAGGRVFGKDPLIGGVTHDSRSVASGDLFVAIPGAIVDGHDYIDRALASGAVAIMAERAVSAPSLVVVDDARAAMPWAAAAVYGNPSERLAVVGVTGTNGKTTVTHMIDRILSAAHVAGGVIGTIGAKIGDAKRQVARTTPEASELQRLLAEMIDAGAEVAAIEVSSHALSLHRVDAVRFRVAAFTNLMQDHLNFHGDMDAYLATKASLFTSERADHAVIVIDDPAGWGIANTTDVPTTTVALSRDADVTAAHFVESLAGTSFIVDASGTSIPIELPMPGRFNAENALVAIAVALELGIATDAIARGLATVGTIAGRFERIDEAQGFGVIVDYAHTPDAISAVVEAALRLSTGKVIAVFGAGGDRDQDKRPAMGRAASRAHLSILTSDNPRSEDPSTIMEAVRRGMPAEANVIEVPDRRVAIRTALEAADPGDLVLVLGKGHETGQDIGTSIEPFDDRAVVRDELRSMTGGPA
jgi:UDP-N-acetylmuramoyl-L-alanyl-D-glutamate--2,6-diaminopimelate ligase